MPEHSPVLFLASALERINRAFPIHKNAVIINENERIVYLGTIEQTQ